MTVSRPSLAIGMGLWLAAFLAAAPLLSAPVYWDESVHYQTARYGTPVDDRFTDVWGNSINSPASLFWQRPAWYATFWLPAQGDLHDLRVAHAVIAAGLAPIAFALLRAYGFHRGTATLAGLAVAVVPPLPLWAAFGFMDPMMAEALGLAALQHRRGRWRSAAAWAVVAVWMKETALLFVALAVAAELARGWVHGTARFWPVEADRRATMAVYALVLAPLPLVYGLLHDVPLPGGVAYHPTLEVADAVWGSSWLALPLAAGLLWRRSRALAAMGIATGLVFVALQLSGRSVESWYLVPSILFGLAGAAAAAECAVRAAWARGIAIRAGAVLAVLAVAGVAGAVAWLPPEHGREHLFPLSGVGPRSLPDTYTYETRQRDLDHLAVMAALPLDEAPTVLLVEPPWPPLYVALADAGHVYMDLAFVRAVVGFDVQALAERIEDNATWTLVYNQVHPMARAVTEVYADCITDRFGGIFLIRGHDCPGRWRQLDEANTRLGGP